MIDKTSMYGNQPEDDQPKKSDTNGGKFDITRDGVIVESNGKKTTVVSKEQYDNVVAELEKTQKQLRILTTEIQQIKRVMNNMAKSMVEGFRDRFNGH